MFALILETLGSFELLFILVIALIFFGPRKLPQLARSVGKGLAEFRKASDDFKRTWEREVAMETARLESSDQEIADPGIDNGFIETPPPDEPLEVATPQEAVAREVTDSIPTATESLSDQDSSSDKLGKHEWL